MYHHEFLLCKFIRKYITSRINRSHKNVKIENNKCSVNHAPITLLNWGHHTTLWQLLLRHLGHEQKPKCILNKQKQFYNQLLTTYTFTRNQFNENKPVNVWLMINISSSPPFEHMDAGIPLWIVSFILLTFLSFLILAQF